MRVPAKLRTVLFVAGLVFLAGYGWLAVQVYRSKTDPEGFALGKRGYGWIIGPPADALHDAARSHMEQGLALLNDTSLQPSERLRLYREELTTAESLLVRSLRAQPAQARVLAELAAVRWELDPPTTEGETQRHLEMIALASSMAPTVPRVQLQLGELLLRMARREEALQYLGRTVELDPGRSPDVVAVLRDNLFSAREIHEALPSHADVLTALRVPFIEDGEVPVYRDVLEETISPGNGSALSSGLLFAYADACLRLREGGRLRERLERLGELEDSKVEASRWHQLSRASLALGEAERAVKEARSSVRGEPEGVNHRYQLGDALLAAEEHGAAIEAYRDALGHLARGSGNPSARARLYSKIGRAEERRGRGDRAYDNYRMALKLDPEEPHAKKRLEEMEAAAGLRPRPGEAP